MTGGKGCAPLLRAAIRRHSGIAFEQEKEYWIEAKLGELMRARGFRSLAQIDDLLRSNADEALLDQVVEACAITETSFFRDTRTFNALSREALPQLIERRSRSRALHIWCAGVATGQEAYSVAMLLRDRAEQLRGWSINIIGSDISRAAIAYGQRGCYSQLEVNRGLPARLFAKHFEQAGLCWRVDAELRAAVDFRCINLIGEWPALPLMDLILLRNVLIYFDRSTRDDVLERVTGLLKPDSLLVLGAAETLGALKDRRIESERFGRAIFYRCRSTSR